MDRTADPQHTAAQSPWRVCVAPMLDWTDRHCRTLHRLLSTHARLYTEMVTTGALLHGDAARHLAFDAAEQPLALQLGGSEPAALAACARLAERWGYAEVNLNCGCPSPRVQRGAFGACLMAEPRLVADCVAAMRDACTLPVTVKHRIGIDRNTSLAFVSDFVGTVAAAGCEVFIVHARNAWLDGLSPKDNRSIPPLRHDVVQALKEAHPHLTVVVNGGIASNDAAAEHLQWADGVMVGREAYHNPWLLRQWDERFWGASTQPVHAASREAVEAQMLAHMQRVAGEGVPWWHVARHMLGLHHGQPGGRAWRRVWSDQRLKAQAPEAVMALARAARLEATPG